MYSSFSKQKSGSSTMTAHDCLWIICIFAWNEKLWKKTSRIQAYATHYLFIHSVSKPAIHKAFYLLKAMNEKMCYLAVLEIWYFSISVISEQVEYQMGGVFLLSHERGKSMNVQPKKPKNTIFFEPCRPASFEISLIPVCCSGKRIF